jgi:tetratricopeptide (TPR) repeat protein
MVAPIFDEALSPNADADEEAMRRYLAQLDKALAGDPTNPVFLGIRGFTAATLARMHLREPAVLEEMIPYMAAAIEVPPSNDETLSAYGTSLYVLGRADELRGLLSDPDVFGSNLPGLAVAAVTKTSGADAGLSMLEVAVPAAQFRARPLVEASIALMLEGDYDAAATLVRAAADAMPTSTPILDLRRVMNNIAALKPLKPKDPLTALEGATDAITEMADALSFAAVPVSDDDAARSMIDLFRAVTVREVRGDKKAGYLVVAEADEDSIGGSFDNGTTWFLASRDKEGWHHLASPGAEGWRIGEVLFDRIEADDPHVVRLWREIDDLIEPNSVAHGLFTRIWSGTMDPEDPAVRRFGAALLAAENYRPDVLDAVEEGLPLVADEQTRFALLAALVWWNQQAERPEAVARLAVGLPEEGVISGYGVRSWALQETGDLAGAEALMRDAVADNPESSEYRDMLGLFLARTGRVDEALDVFEEGAELQEITANFYNNHAWVTLLAGRSEEAAEFASLGLRRSGEARAESLLHTYAAAQADLGKVDEAWEAFQDARGVVESGEGDASSMGDHWWYVLGRIAESVGMPTEAATAYRKVEQDDGPMATWKLSERRLKALGETP